MSVDQMPDVDLTVSVTDELGPDEIGTDGIGAGKREFRLVARGGAVSDESTVPDPSAALAAVERFGEEIFFAVPRPDMLCTQQYGGPQVALVTGLLYGRRVHSRFSLTDGCEIARWRAMAPLLGGSAS
jgi:hypothetical protein